MRFNRKLKRGEISKIAQAIRNDKWVTTVQGLIFDRKGRFIDGQNRCFAILLAGKAVQVEVTYGAKAEEFKYLDRNSVRSESDILTLESEEQINPKAVAIAKALKDGSSRSGEYDPDQIMEIYHAFRPQIDKAEELTSGLKQTGTKGAALGAVIARALWSHSHEDVATFVEVIKTNNVVRGTEDNPALTLSSWMKRTVRGTRNKGERTSIYRVAQHAMYCFLTKQPLKRINPRTYDKKNMVELFPLSDEEILVPKKD